MKSEKDLINCTTNGVPNEYIFVMKELAVYEKALDMACEDIAKSHPILSALGYDYYKDRYLQKARKS